MINRIHLLVFLVNNYGNHCGLYVEKFGFVDLSLIGVRKISLNHPKFPTMRFNAYKVNHSFSKNKLDFFQKQQKLASQIIEMEKTNRGWNKLEKSGDYILNFRSLRSQSRASLNCVEWVLLGLESILEIKIPNNILSPMQLDDWCKEKFHTVGSGISVPEFLKRLEM